MPTTLLRLHQKEKENFMDAMPHQRIYFAFVESTIEMISHPIYDCPFYLLPHPAPLKA